MLPPFYGTFTQNENVMTSNKFLKYHHPTKPQKAYATEGWFDWNHISWAGSDKSAVDSQSVVCKLCLEAQAAHLFL